MPIGAVSIRGRLALHYLKPKALAPSYSPSHAKWLRALNSGSVCSFSFRFLLFLFSFLLIFYRHISR